MKRISAFALAVLITIISLTASPGNEAAAQYRRKGQAPVAGHIAMYCSTMHNINIGAKDTINAPEGYHIVAYEIWASTNKAQLMTLKFFMDIADDSTEVDIRVWSSVADPQTGFWYWNFPLTCDRIIMANTTWDGAWSSCVYIMRYGAGAGVTGIWHPWPRLSGF